MYSWIWRHLPGPGWVRGLILAVAAVAVVVLLFLVVFPWLSPRLPFTDTTIEALTTQVLERGAA